MIMKALHLLLTLASSSFSMSSLDVGNSLRVILGVLSPWPTEPIISCSFSWFTSAYMLIQGIFLNINRRGDEQMNLGEKFENHLVGSVFLSHYFHHTERNFSHKPTYVFHFN